MTYAEYICRLNRTARQEILGNRKEMSPEHLSQPMAMWLAPDRLHSGPGQEFVLILRTVGCKYARDPAGGCTVCGYLNDAPANAPSAEQLRSQFQDGCRTFLENVQEKHLPPASVAFKIFTSGSFFDPEEVPPSLQDEIFAWLARNPAVGEIAVESRPEFIKALDYAWLARVARQKHLDVGVGLEAVSDAFRDTYIHKGFSYADFLACHDCLKAAGAGTKVYLTLKPPLASESASIAEVALSMQTLLDLHVDTISLNPVAVQRDTVVDVLFQRKQYRPPWLYSTLFALEMGTRWKDITATRILCDPIAKGKERGAHNCRNPSCNDQCLAILQHAVMTQQFQGLVDQVNCWCKTLWQDSLARFE